MPYQNVSWDLLALLRKSDPTLFSIASIYFTQILILEYILYVTVIRFLIKY